jgi:uncharacterized membrane protein YbhN (UPF0104 family)
MLVGDANGAMPALPDLLAMGAAVFGVATWIIPLLRYVWQSRTPRQFSLVRVGHVIGLLVLAGCFSAAGLLLALLAFLFAERSGWAWAGLGAIAGYWLALAVFVGVGSHVSRRKRDAGGVS